MGKLWLSASMCHCSLHRRDRALQVLLPWSRESSPKPGSLLIEVTTKVMKLTDSIKKKVKKERGGPIRGPEDTRSPSEKLWKKKNLRRKSKSNVSGRWAKVSWRNKSFSQQSQREITEHSIGMHSGRFYAPKGSFLIFWTGLGSRKVGAKSRDACKRRNLKLNNTKSIQIA